MTYHAPTVDRSNTVIATSFGVAWKTLAFIGLFPFVIIVGGGVAIALSFIISHFAWFLGVTLAVLVVLWILLKRGQNLVSRQRLAAQSQHRA